MSVCNCPIKISHGMSYTENVNVCFKNKNNTECSQLCNDIIGAFSGSLSVSKTGSHKMEENTTSCDYVISDVMDFAENTLDRIIYADECNCETPSGPKKFLIDLQFTDQCSLSECQSRFPGSTSARIGSSRVSTFGIEDDSTEAPVGTEKPTTTKPTTMSPITTQSPISTTLKSTGYAGSIFPKTPEGERDFYLTIFLGAVLPILIIIIICIIYRKKITHFLWNLSLFKKSDSTISTTYKSTILTTPIPTPTIPTTYELPILPTQL